MHDFCIEIAVSWKWNQKISFFARFQNHHSRSLFAIYIWCFHVRKYVKQFHFWEYSQPPPPTWPWTRDLLPCFKLRMRFLFWISQKMPPLSPFCPSNMGNFKFPSPQNQKYLIYTGGIWSGFRKNERAFKYVVDISHLMSFLSLLHR